MNEEQIIDIWLVFKEYLDKKQIDVIAEKYVDMIADYGYEDHQFKDLLGHCPDLDEAIHYYLETDNLDDDDYNEWDD